MFEFVWRVVVVFKVRMVVRDTVEVEDEVEDEEVGVSKIWKRVLNNS